MSKILSEQEKEKSARVHLMKLCTYDGTCSSVVKKILKLNKFTVSCTEGLAIFVPIAKYKEFKQKRFKIRRVWSYDLKICNSIYRMKLAWCKLATKILTDDPKLQPAFSFLQPKYLRYLDKPFWNPDAITQVNLILDYHRTQKRRRGIEIFNIFELIAFKMAIDDNRYEYVNCEFHKIIDRTLGELVQSELYMDEGDKFNLDKYMYAIQYYQAEVTEIVDYMVYHFQKTIGSIYWSDFINLPNKLSTITNVPAYLERCWRDDPKQAYMKIVEIDSGGKCAKVLYDLIIKSKVKLKFRFELDCEWVYTGVENLLQEITEPLAECDITIDTKNSFNFIENFINWLKLSFGEQCSKITLDIRKFKKINPYIFTSFHIDYLEIGEVELDHNFISRFKNIKWIKNESYCFSDCRIPDDINERMEYFRRGSANGPNIFKLLDELQNVDYIHLALEEHTIGTLFAHVAAGMLDKQLDEFQFKNDIRLIRNKRQIIHSYYRLRFWRSDINTDFVHMEALDSDYSVGDFNELINGLEPSSRDEFSFYD